MPGSRSCPAVVPTSVRASSISIPTPEPLSFADGPGDCASWWAISSIASWLVPGSIAITFCIGIEWPLGIASTEGVDAHLRHAGQPELVCDPARGARIAGGSGGAVGRGRDEPRGVRQRRAAVERLGERRRRERARRVGADQHDQRRQQHDHPSDPVQGPVDERLRSRCRGTCAAACLGGTPPPSPARAGVDGHLSGRQYRGDLSAPVRQSRPYAPGRVCPGGEHAHDDPRGG